MSIFSIYKVTQIAGLIFLGGGGYIISNEYIDLAGFSSGIANASVILGLVVTLIAFLGIAGATNQSRLLLRFYFGLVLLLVLLQFSIGVGTFVKRDEIPFVMKQKWINAAIGNGNQTIISIENYVFLSHLVSMLWIRIYS